MLVPVWDGGLVDFNTDIEYKCLQGQKFLNDFGQISQKSQCLPGNVWTQPAQWGQCVESKAQFVFDSIRIKIHHHNTIFFFFEKMHIMLFNLVIKFLVLLAKTCTMPPPPPDGGSVTVHSEGYMYGKNCSTGGIYVPIEPIDGGGCGIPKFTQMERKIVGNNIESKYKITIDKSPPGGAAALLLTFSQPVTPASVVITGSVRYSF